jgi:hypothetical protein
MTPNARAPGGFFGRVTKVGTQPGVLVVNTVPAAVNEALTDGSLAADGQLTNADVASFTALSPGVRLAEPTIDGRTAKAGAPSVSPGTNPTAATGRSGTAAESPNVGIRDGALVLELQTEPMTDARGRGGKLELQAQVGPGCSSTLKVGLGGVSSGTTVRADTETHAMGKFPSPARSPTCLVRRVPRRAAAGRGMEPHGGCWTESHGRAGGCRRALADGDPGDGAGRGLAAYLNRAGARSKRTVIAGS